MFRGVSCIVLSQSLFDNVTPKAFLMMDNAVSYSLNFPSVAFALLSYYGPDAEPYPQPLTKGRLLSRWLRTYPEQWVCWALIESIYQGRYKIFCVEKILALWQRRGQPSYHFNDEFETMICSKVPQRIASMAVSDALKEAAMDDINLTISPKSEVVGILASSALREETTAAVLSEPSSDSEEMGLSPQLINEDRNIDWADAFEQPLPNTQQDFDLSSVLSCNQLLPLTFERAGLEPIHRFMPEAEPIEFCEKLAAIARSHH
jgi:hypothetical protein